MKPFRSSVLREIRRYGKDRSLVIVTVIIPVMMALGYVAMFSKGGINDLPVAVYDGDKTPTSRQLIDMIDATPTMHVALKSVDIGQAHEALRKGEVNAIVNIPNGMEEKILSAQGASVTATVNGTYITKMSLITRDLTTVFQAFNIGAESQILVAQGKSEAQSYALAYPVVLEKHILFNPFGSYSYYLLPGLMPLILIIIVIITTIYVVGSELRYGTAKQWLDTANGSIARALMAKLSPYFVIFIILTIFFNTILYRYMGLPMRAQDIGVLVLASVLLITSHMSLGLILVAITANMRFSLSIGAAVTIASFSFSGLTFPHIAMYKPIVAIAQLIPFTHYMEIFIEGSMRGAPINYITDEVAILGAITLLCAPFIPLLKRRCGNEKFYGRL